LLNAISLTFPYKQFTYSDLYNPINFNYDMISYQNALQVSDSIIQFS